MNEKRLIVNSDYAWVDTVTGAWIDDTEAFDLVNELYEENQLLKNKIDKIDEILPLFLSCSEISEFRGKIVEEDIALMKCWNKKYEGLND
jgi:hypothetical protein